MCLPRVLQSLGMLGGLSGGEASQLMKKKLRNIEKREAAAVKRMQRPQVTEDSSTVMLRMLCPYW